MEILRIHANPIRKTGEIDYEAIVKLSEGFNGAGTVLFFLLPSIFVSFLSPSFDFFAFVRHGGVR